MTTNADAAGPLDRGVRGWCPTRQGTYTAYEPQWLNKETWQRIPTTNAPGGVPQPLLCGGVNAELFLFGYEQAQALAWTFSALAAAEGKHIEVRAQPFEVIYDLKARAIDDEAPND